MPAITLLKDTMFQTLVTQSLPLHRSTASVFIYVPTSLAGQLQIALTVPVVAILTEPPCPLTRDMNRARVGDVTCMEVVRAFCRKSPQAT